MPKNKIKLILLIALGLAFWFAIFKAFKAPVDNKTTIDPNVALKDSVNALKLELGHAKTVSDSLKSNIGLFEWKLSAQKNNIELIKQKYEKSRILAIQLNAVSAVELLTKNLAADSGN